MEEHDLSRILWIRVEGGEPLASTFHARYIYAVLETLKKAYRRFLVKRRILVIQTNGIWLGSSPDNVQQFYDAIVSILRSSNTSGNIRIAVEISFKGGNRKACRIYSGITNKVLELQCKAFSSSLKALEGYWKEGFHQVAVYPVAGFGPAFNDLVIIPLDPEALERNAEIPLFHKDTWSSDFSEIVDAFRRIVREYREVYSEYVRYHGDHMHMYGFELRGRKWQTAWLSRVDRDKALKTLAKKYLRLNRKNLRYAGYYIKPLQRLDLDAASDTVLEKTLEMQEYFAEAEPANHYPYL